MVCYAHATRVMHSNRILGLPKHTLRCGLAAAAIFAGCGSARPATVSRTELERRRDAACQALAPTLSRCAREDAAADLAAGKVTKADFDRNTAPELLRQNAELFVAKCAAWHDISSRQVRVLEVCFRAESQCGPLNDCLANLLPK